MANADAWKAYSLFTNQLATARFQIVAQPNGVRFYWLTNQSVRLGFNFDEARGLVEHGTKRVIELNNVAVSSVRRFNPGDPTKSAHSKPTQALAFMDSRAKAITEAFGWEINDTVAPAWPDETASHFSTAGGTWAFRWHRKVNSLRLFHERVQVFISDKGLDLESFKSTITTNAYDFPVGPLLTTNALHEAILKHVKLNYTNLLERGTPDKKMPTKLIVKEVDLPRELYVFEADYTRRWNYLTPAKGPKGKPKEPRLAWHIYYDIHDGTPGRGEKLLHRDFGCFDAINGDALMHNW